MCFSAQASFTGAVCLGAIGLATLRYVHMRAQLLMALVPCFFALQQFSEGMLWVELTSLTPDPLIKQNAIYIFLFFAIFFWPIWIPFSLYVMEEKPTNQKLLFLMLLGGCALAFTNLYYGFSQEPKVLVVENSIRYLGTLPDEKWIYLSLVTLPSFISSFKNMWQFGVVVFFTSMLAEYFYDAAYVSVWCFFAAIVSVVLFKIFRDNYKLQSMTQS